MFQSRLMQRFERGLLAALFILSFFGGGVLGYILYSLNHLTGITLLEEYRPEIPTRFFDRNGQLISEYFLQRRILVGFDDLPPSLVQAIVVKEDREFYAHKGINPQGIVRAFLVNLFAGRIRQGGSTLTQQFAKVLFTSQKRSYVRKLKEIWLALQIERLYTKNEILEMYFNQIYFGHGAYGVEAAARFYFGKSCADLDVMESSLLAILPNAPNYYSPVRNPDVARRQHRRLLRQMAAMGYVSRPRLERDFRAFWDRYLAMSREREAQTWNIRTDYAPHFTEYIRQMLVKKYGEKNVYGQGLQVYTTLDLRMQQAADRAVQYGLVTVSRNYRQRKRQLAEVWTGRIADVLDLLTLAIGYPNWEFGPAKNLNRVSQTFDEDTREALSLTGAVLGLDRLEGLLNRVYNRGRDNTASEDKVEAALVAVEPSTGAIRAMVGGREFNTANQLNRAVQMRRQAGSAFKPFVYAAAIASGKFTAGSSVEDSPMVYFDKTGRKWIPNNYGGEYHGFVTLRKALEKSINIISIKIADAVGVEPILRLASSILGFSSDIVRMGRLRRDLSIALGNVDVSPLEMAAAFGSFANYGIAVVPYAVREVRDRDGRLLESWETAVRSQPRQHVLSAKVAYIVADMLRNVLEPGGTAYNAVRSMGFGHIAYGKTGTTDNWKDAWFIGFTPQLSTAVWVGFDNPAISLGIHNTGGQVAAPIWASFMNVAMAIYRPESTRIAMPNGIVRVRICGRTGLLPTPECQEVIEENFIEGTQPTSPCELCPAESGKGMQVIDRYLTGERRTLLH